MSDENNAPLKFVKHVGLISSQDESTFYTNVASLAISAEEVVIRFGLTDPNNPEAPNSLARVYMTPAHAKRLSNALIITINQYESNFGIIEANPDNLLTPEARNKIEVEA